MNKAAAASAYEVFQIEKNGKVVDISGTDPYGPKPTSFDYYESLLSPNVSAVLSLMDIGGSSQYDSKYNKQSGYGTLNSAFLLSGDINVSFKITSKSGSDVLDFTKNPLIFDKQINPSQESNREGIVIGLVSRAAKTNMETAIQKSYRGKISENVRKILKEELKVIDNRIFIDETKIPYDFEGKNRDPFSTILGLCPRSTPIQGNPGYFFYETRDGFNFKSIDSLISQAPPSGVSEYFRTDALQSNLDNDFNDYKIVRKFDIKKEDIITSLKCGIYRARNYFFNHKTLKYEELDYELTELEQSLGKSIEIPNVSSYTRTYFNIKDIASLSPVVGGSENNDPKEWQAKSPMRYNSLFTQIIEIQVPCNLKLKAGNTIICNFETITQSRKVEGAIDPVNSGKYLILNLCHHFDPLRSFTSMTLVRDSYGLYKK
jgi:hypothetical protein